MAPLPANLPAGSILQVTVDDPHDAPLLAGDLVTVVEAIPGFESEGTEFGPAYFVHPVDEDRPTLEGHPIAEILGMKGWATDGRVARHVPADEIGG